jgi:hypothetical protein
MACFDFQDKYSKEDIRALENMHTKQLLNERNRLYHAAECSANYYVSNSPECEACCQNRNYNMEQVKKILATREHVLNKQESKALRKLKIKEGK